MRYLSKTEIVTINVCIQQHYGQKAAIRDVEALDYIVRSAAQSVFGRQLYETEVDLATFYFVKLIKKHVFNDCNKRTAYLSVLDCLALNEVPFRPDATQRRRLADLAIHVAQVDAEPQSLWTEVQTTIQAMIGSS